MLLAVFPALLLDVLLVEFFLFLRLVVGCRVGSAAGWTAEGESGPGQPPDLVPLPPFFVHGKEVTLYIFFPHLTLQQVKGVSCWLIFSTKSVRLLCS